MTSGGRSRSAALRDGLSAALFAGVASGAPSTIHALATGADPLEPSRAAGTLLLPTERRSAPLLASGALAHALLSLWWGAVLARFLPAGAGAGFGAGAGLGIAVVDLGLGARLRPAIRSLSIAPQVADHIAFGAVAGAVIAGRRTRRLRSRRAM